MAIRNNQTPDHASEAEQQEIWDDYETVWMRESNRADSHIHLYEDCQAFPNRDDYEPTEKELAVYPVGYKQICRNCIFRWRRD